MGKAAVRSSGKKNSHTKRATTDILNVSNSPDHNQCLPLSLKSNRPRLFGQLLSLLFYMLSYFNVSSLY